MRREICALLLLAALVGASVWNIRKTDRLIGEIEEHVALSEKAAQANDPDYALRQLEAALRIWLDAGNYTRVVLRHPELDGTTDVFYEVLETLRDGENRALPAAYERLRYHLDSIGGMEHVTLGTVM